MRTTIGLGLGLVAAWLLLAFWIEPRRLTVTEPDVQTPSWPEDTRPLRVVLLSDFHVGGWHMPPERVQVRLPLIGAPVRMSRHTEDTADGWAMYGDRILIVTRGLGESGFPVRLNTAPQIMVLTVRPGPQPIVRAQRG